MKQVHHHVMRMARSRFAVLILGETGTGKGLVARAIHDLEPRGPFVVVDCSSLVGPLMESELFGYAKGAFTGAFNQKLGLLDAANGGTAFFDEVGELPFEMQMKLLRVLQDKEFRAIGALSQRASNFRVIAATNRDLAADVASKRFRQDLYYRLSVMRLRVPPLREHKEDVPTLISHFLGQYGNGHKVAAEVMDALTEYDWPGNVRELEHAVKQMVALNSGTWLTATDLPSSIANRSFERALEAQGNGNAKAPVLAGPGQSVIPLAEVEKRAIVAALEYTRGDRTLAAAMLGIGRTTLYRKLKEYGLVRLGSCGSRSTPHTA